MSASRPVPPRKGASLQSALYMGFDLERQEVADQRQRRP